LHLVLVTSRVLVVGGGAAGLSAVTAAKDRGANVTLMHEGATVGERKSLMPFLVSGEVTEKGILSDAPQSVLEGVDLRLEECVKEIDVSRGLVRSGRGSCHFDRLVLATGSSLSLDKLPGISKRNVFVMGGLADYAKLAECVSSLTRVAVLGSTPVSLLLAEVLIRKNVKVVVFMPSGSTSSWLPEAMTKLLVKRMREEGAESQEGAIDTIAGVNRVEAVVSNGRVHACDGVVLFPRGAPHVPPSALALGRQGGVLVDSGMRTSSEGVFAAGDCTEIKYRSSSRSVRLESSARVMGTVAGANAAGGRAIARISGAISHTIFGLEVCGAGIGTGQARAVGIDPVEVTSDAAGRDALFGREETLCTIVLDRSTRSICGVFLAGWRASSYGDAVSLIVSSGLRLEEVSYFDSPYSPKISPCLSPITLTARKAAAVIGEPR